MKQEELDELLESGERAAIAYMIKFFLNEELTTENIRKYHSMYLEYGRSTIVNDIE